MGEISNKGTGMIAVKKQDEVEILSHDNGEICLRQYNPNGDDDDVIVFWPEHADAIVAAILKAKNDVETGQPINVAFPA